MAADTAAARLQHMRSVAWQTLQRAKRGDRVAQNRLVTAALGFSIVFHAILLAVRFVIDDDKRCVGVARCWHRARARRLARRLARLARS